LQPALKKLADKYHRKVRISWNQLFFLEMNYSYSTNAFDSLCFVLTSLPVYILLALNYFQNKILFSHNAKIIRRGAIFKQSSWRGEIVQKKVEDY